MSDTHSADRVTWWLDLLSERADALRTAGVSSVAVDGLSATFLPLAPPQPSFADIKLDDQIPDGLPAHLDPRTYPGGIVPGFDIQPLPEED